jgi:hypothetical protein
MKRLFYWDNLSTVASRFLNDSGIIYKNYFECSLFEFMTIVYFYYLLLGFYFSVTQGLAYYMIFNEFIQP